jgi:zinc-ribbon domain
MYCPHCGTENDAGNRFCVNCGSELAAGGADAGESPGARERLLGLVGKDRRSRLITLTTIAALAIALVAFLFLDSEGEDSSQSPYLQALDRACVAEKQRVIRLERQTLGRQTADPQEFAAVLVAVLAEWRASLKEMPAPPQEAEGAEALEASLLQTLIEAGKLARLIRAGAPSAEIAAEAGKVDSATTQLDATIDATGLDACADLDVSPVAAGK